MNRADIDAHNALERTARMADAERERVAQWASIPRHRSSHYRISAVPSQHWAARLLRAIWRWC